MRISDWSSDVRSSDRLHLQVDVVDPRADIAEVFDAQVERPLAVGLQGELLDGGLRRIDAPNFAAAAAGAEQQCGRSEEHTSELQSLMRISYAVFCLKKKKHHQPKSSTPTGTESTIST